MRRVRFSARARDDLLDIWRSVALVNPAAADQVIDRIAASCGVLVDHPQIGRARPEIGEGARMLVINRWLALYRLTNDGVQVVCVVHGARDLGQFTWLEEDV